MNSDQQLNDGGPVYPVALKTNGGFQCGEMGELWQYPGISLRAYAAIKLRVPESGIDWLDDMIVKAKRDELAATALQGMLAQSASGFFSETRSPSDFAVKSGKVPSEVLPELAFVYADNMLQQREQK